jgi:hypothetical protein
MSCASFPTQTPAVALVGEQEHDIGTAAPLGVARSRRDGSGASRVDEPAHCGSVRRSRRRGAIAGLSKIHLASERMLAVIPFLVDSWGWDMAGNAPVVASEE